MTTALTMYVTPGLHIPSSPQSGKLLEDPSNPTPSLTAVSVTGGTTTPHGIYNIVSKTATCALTSTDYTTLYNLLYSAPNQVRVDLSYDETASGNSKPITVGPTFTAI